MAGGGAAPLLPTRQVALFQAPRRQRPATGRFRRRALCACASSNRKNQGLTRSPRWRGPLPPCARVTRRNPAQGWSTRRGAMPRLEHDGAPGGDFFLSTSAAVASRRRSACVRRTAAARRPSSTGQPPSRRCRRRPRPRFAQRQPAHSRWAAAGHAPGLRS